MQPVLSDEWYHVRFMVDFPSLGLTLAIAVVLQGRVWRSLNRQAMKAAQARYTFLATMSHEIRTPLNGILGLTEILLESELDSDQRNLATTVRSSGKLLRTLLDDVLDYSKIDSGHMEAESIAVHLPDQLTQLLRLWEGPAAERGLTVDVQTAPDLTAWIRTDPTRLSQILGNLVSNAVKFTESGGITIRANRDGGRLQFQVIDTGRGISEASQQHIFDAFRQADGTTTRQFGGTGLGLAISQRLARLLGGDLTVESTLGQGSTFTLSLPYEPCAAPQQASLELSAGVSAPASVLAGIRVLVAEDNPVNQLVIRRFLEGFEVEFELVSDGAECVEAWPRFRPDVILMDCQMPVCDGYEATRLIRKEGGSMAIIALTASSMPGDLSLIHISEPTRPY